MTECQLDRHGVDDKCSNQFEFVEFKLERQFGMRTPTDVLLFEDYDCNLFKLNSIFVHVFL